MHLRLRCLNSIKCSQLPLLYCEPGHVPHHDWIKSSQRCAKMARHDVLGGVLCLAVFQACSYPIHPISIAHPRNGPRHQLGTT